MPRDIVGAEGNPELLALIREAIAEAGGRIPFVRFMELALYAPGLGYYARQHRDYQTSPELHPLFGTLVARQLEQMWHLLGQPAPFRVVEMGAGPGLLARGVLDYFGSQVPGATVEYRALERRAGPPLDGLTWVTTPLEEWPADGVEGCLFSNELVDAFPVHRVVMQEGRLQEVYVTLVDDEFEEVLDQPCTPDLEQHFRWLGLPLEEGHRAEVNMEARRWMAQVARVLRRGFVLTIDYGYPAEELYARPQGTLLCYHRQQWHDNPYRWVGQQDITAHVDFTTLAKAGEEGGLRLAGMVRQADFMRNLGLDGYLRAAEAAHQAGQLSPARYYDHKFALRELVDRRSLGQFWVLIQHKGLEPPVLDGLNPVNQRKLELSAQPPVWPWGE